ncbi:prophage CP4-57 integrase [mine drainage metagenome]|uniref:Prophage CP4-57 integrase n=1 Tax=mine drainage metagenome TaxID=410659 RepID=A0A1J5R8J1_9ZZZZ
MLSDLQVRKASAREKAYKLADYGGLYLFVSPSGGRLWRLKYRFDGREKTLSLGPYPLITLAAARDAALEAKRTLAGGTDPSAAKKAAREPDKPPVLFADVAEKWLAWRRAAWTEGTADAVRASLENHAFPTLGKMPIESIKAADVRGVVEAIDKKGAGETAGRVFQRLKAIFRYAVTHEHLRSVDDPMYSLQPGEIIAPRKVRHRAALAASQVPAFFAGLDEYKGYPAVTLGLQLLMLTGVRPGELRGACWPEFDVRTAMWRIPAERMKMKTEHRVPLSSQALAILKQLRELELHHDLVLPSPFYPEKSISNGTFNSALSSLGFKGAATAHGFRALFSTEANEAGFHPDVIELQLAHVERDDVRAAYNFAQRLAERAALMTWWGDRVDELKAPDDWN